MHKKPISPNQNLHFHCLPFHQLSATELYALMALRQEVFVVEQNCPYLDADGKDLSAHHLLGYNENGRLVAYSRLLPKGVAYEKHPSFGRVVTAASIRGNGQGRNLMEKTLEWMRRLYGQDAIKISAQCYLISFYESLGFQTVGKEYLEDDIPHIGMVRKPTLNAP
ncbi:MAG: GNAT family N-acetyltransferase [Phaeodactylibacter sp.]|nr:GNAT family N-acetyltransferase [Phaeodactylibacter sp.]